MQDESERLTREVLFERRRFVRIDSSFVISYTDISGTQPKSDITQTKNISLGGILFTTDREFPKEAILKVRLRLPDIPDYINVKVQVVGSRQRVKDVLYEIRAKFIAIKDENRESMSKIIEYYLRKK